jgi:hypothetical protein
MIMAQWGAAVRIELLLAWRRRTLLFLPIFFLIILFGFDALNRANGAQFSGEVLTAVTLDGEDAVLTYLDVTTGATRSERAPASAGAVPRWLAGVDVRAAQATLSAMFVVAIGISLILTMLMPILAEVAPLDRQHRTRELLDATPLRSSAYYGAKVLAHWLGLSVGFALVGAIYGVVVGLRGEGLFAWEFARAWAALVLLSVMVGSSGAILLASWARSRRAAVLIGVALIPVAIGVYIAIIIQLFGLLSSADGLASVMDVSFGGFIDVLIGRAVVILLAALAVIAGLYALVVRLRRV